MSIPAAPSAEETPFCQQGAGTSGPNIAPAAAVSLGDEHRERGRLHEAAAAYRWAVDSDDSDIAPWAAGQLGGVLREQGRLDEAATAYQWAVDSGSDIAPFVSVTLGDVRWEQDRLEEAATAYQWAVDSDHPDIAPLAAVKLQSMKEH